MSKKERNELSPIEALEQTIFRVYNGFQTYGADLAEVSAEKWKRLKPGALVEAMPEKVKNALKKLTSQDFASIRQTKELFMDDYHFAKKKFEKLKTDFDKRIKR